ncbi:MAG: hypothetical protein JKX70_10935 [Phycisphaerales bacterium]|nr:hypothetical protein [Phycisphaerales bacterium]
MKAKSALTVAMAAGIASTAVAANTPTTLTPDSARVVNVAHIYFNIASGERVVTLLGDGQTAPADTGASTSVWASRVDNQCADAGYTTTWFFGVDNNSPTSMGGPHTDLATDITNLDFGDIALDSLIDCIHIDWVTDHDDVDADSDGIGDGVVGLSGEWIMWDADNGRSGNFSTRLPIISFTLTDLPGDTSGTTDPDDPLNTLAGYTADIDLAASFASSLTFEIGDSDGDLQGAAFGNNMVPDPNGGPDAPVATLDRDSDGFLDSDLDGDGLFDFAWSVRFGQPGTRDLDGDGMNEGDFAASMKSIGISFGAGAGTSIDNGDGTWAWDRETTGDAATGQEDAFAIYAPPSGPNDDIFHAGFFWFGGYECSSVPLDEMGPGYTPTADFEFQLFTPGVAGCDNPADFDGNETLNFFDVAAFLGFFGAQDPQADFSPPGAPDGVFNFFDVAAFLGFFGEGCPATP